MIKNVMMILGGILLVFTTNEMRLLSAENVRLGTELTDIKVQQTITPTLDPVVIDKVNAMVLFGFGYGYIAAKANNSFENASNSISSHFPEIDLFVSHYETNN